MHKRIKRLEQHVFGDGNHPRPSISKDRHGGGASGSDGGEPSLDDLVEGQPCVNVDNDHASQCQRIARWCVRRSCRNTPKGGRWQFTCDVCAQWMEAQDMIDVPYGRIRRRDVVD